MGAFARVEPQTCSSLPGCAAPLYVSLRCCFNNKACRGPQASSSSIVGLQPTVIASRAPHLLLEQSVNVMTIQKIKKRFKESRWTCVARQLKQGSAKNRGRALLSLHNPVARAVHALAGHYSARKGLCWFSKSARFHLTRCLRTLSPNQVLTATHAARAKGSG